MKTFIQIQLIVTLIGISFSSFSQGVWSTKLPMSVERQHLCSAVFDNKIYVFGGELNNGQFTTLNEMYDPQTNFWTTKAAMPSALGFCNAGTCNNKIYVIGGWDGGYQTNENWEYDPVLDTWAVKANMPTIRSDAAVAVVGNKIYAIGGWQYGSNPRNENEMYDPVTNTWETKAPMPTARGYFTVAVVNNKIYAIGGGNSVYTTQVEEYDPQTDQWTTKSNMPIIKAGLASVVINNEIYLFGGTLTNPDTTLIYNPVSDSWRTAAVLPTHRSFVAASQVNGHAYVFGGGSISGIYAANEMFAPGSEGKIFFSAKPSSGNFFSIYSMNTDGTNKVKLFNDNYHRRCPIISNDHSKIFYLKRKLEIEIDKDSTWICKSNLDGSGEEIIWTNLTPLSFGLRSDFDISPDNEKLIYAVFAEPGRDGDIFEYTIVSQTLVNLTNDWDYLEDDPIYSPDALKIIYTKNSTTWYAWPWTMLTMDSNGSNNTLFQPNGSGAYGRPEYSLDGSKLVYCYSNTLGAAYSLYTCNSNGTGIQQIIPSAGMSNSIFDPTFSPDRSKLAFSRNNATQLLITDLNGNIIHQFDTLGIKGFYEIEWGLVNTIPTSLPVSVSISASANPVCAGSNVTYTAVPTNGGNNPQYQWKVNGNNSGTNSTTFNYIPTNNDLVTCVLTSDLPGSTGNPATSVAIIVNVNPLPNNIGQSSTLGSLQNGLVAYYPFNGNANDESGNGNNGVVNGVTPSADRFGNENSAYSFDGMDDYIVVPNNNILNLGKADFSFSFWIKYPSQVGGYDDYSSILTKADAAYPYSGLSFFVEKPILGKVTFRTSASNTLESKSSNLNNNTWTLYTGTRNGNTLKLFINGIIDTTFTTTTIDSISNNFDLYFGGHNTDLLAQKLKGILDEICIYNRTLTPVEIAGLYNSLSTGGNLSVQLAEDTICSGSNTSLTIQNSQAGISYQPISNGSNYGNSQTGNGNTLTFPINGLTQPTSFIVLATDTSTNCSVTLDSTFTVYVIPLPGNIGEPTGLNPLQNGLVAYYPFNGNANDESGNGINGYVFGATLTQDRFGNVNKAYSFNGLNNWIQASGLTLSMPSVSECAWVYSNTNSPNTSPQIIGIYPPDNQHVMQMETTSSNQIFYNASPYGVTITNPNIWNASQWHFICGTYDGFSEKIYVDGVLAANNPRTGNYQITLQDIFIGRQNNPGCCYWNGKLDEVRIYNRALSPLEIACLYNNNCIGGNLEVQLTSDTICSGSNTSLTIQNSQTGISYQLLNNGSNYGNPQTGNGNTLTFPINGLTQPTSFTILATNIATNCSVTLDSTFTVNLYPVVIASASTNVTICSGTSTTLTASGGSGYLWSNGTTTSSNMVSPLTTTVYYVTVTNTMGCSDTASVLVSVTPALPVSVILTASATTVCAGDTVHFTAHTINQGSNATLQWYVNGVQVSGGLVLNGLVSHYPFDGNTADATGNSQNAVLNGNVSPTTDRFNNPNSAYYIGGNSTGSDYLTVAHSNALAIHNPFSVSVWINKEAHGGWIINKGRDIINGYGINDAGGNAQVVYSGNNGAYITNTTVSLNQWHLYTCVFKGDSASFYLDGFLANKQKMASSTYASTSSDYPMAFGRHFTNCCYNTSPSYYSYPFKGKVDDVRIYNRSLTAYEVLQLYQGNDSTFSYVPQNGDVVTCVLTATGSCLTNNPATSNAITMTVNPLPVPVISGANTVCSGAVGSVYSTEPAMTNYIWSISPGGTITSGAATNSITVSWNTTGAQTVSVVYTDSNSCTAAPATVYNVMVNPMAAPVLNGVAAICASVTGNIYTTQAGMNNYVWSISAGGTITSGGTPTSNTVTVTWNTAGTQTVSVNYTNPSGCTASTPSVFNVTVNPVPVPTITGSAAVCNGSTGIIYTTEAGMSAYTWTVSAGGTITSGAGTNSITATWNTMGAQTVSVNYADANACLAAIPTVKTVTVNPMAAPTLTGPISLCQGTTGNIYTTEPGMNSYLWTVSPSGIITSGGTTTSNTVTITWTVPGPQSVSVNYTNVSGCTASNSTSTAIIVSPFIVPTVSGPNNACLIAGNYTYSTEPGMSGYTWSISTSGTIVGGLGTNSVTVHWITAGNHSLTVNYTNPGGCSPISPTVYNVNIYTNPIPYISGLGYLCVNSGFNYFYSTEEGMTNYQWTVSPGGTIISGANTNLLTVTWNLPGEQWVRVNYTNNGGCTASVPTKFGVFVKPLPDPAGTITGLASVCAGALGVPYSVPPIANATSYTWTLPAGASLGSGNGTNSITVNFSMAAISGNISVLGVNDCGNGTISADFPVTINQAPDVASTISGTSTVCQGQSNVAYSVAAIPLATAYQWTFSGTGVTFGNSTTNSITINFEPNATSGILTVSGSNTCGIGTASTNYPIIVNPLPSVSGPISGTSNVCQGQSAVTYSIAAIPLASSYVWTYSGSGATITNGSTNNITISFALNATSGNLTVRGVNACGNGGSSALFPISVKLLPVADAGLDKTVANGTSTTLSGSATGGSVCIHGIGNLLTYC
jgi:hypothetical protein